MNKAIENENKLVSKRYAKALLDIADKDDKLRERFLSDLSDVCTSVMQSEDLTRVLTSPVVSSDEKKNLIEKLFKKDTSPVVVNLLKILTDKGRFHILSSICKEYKSVIDNINGLLCIKVTSAIELNKYDRAMMKVKLEKILKKDVDIEWFVDSDILAGLVFEVGDDIIDKSLRHKLQDISRNIVK